MCGNEILKRWKKRTRGKNYAELLNKKLPLSCATYLKKEVIFYNELCLWRFFFNKVSISIYFKFQSFKWSWWITCCIFESLRSNIELQIYKKKLGSNCFKVQNKNKQINKLAVKSSVLGTLSILQ